MFRAGCLSISQATMGWIKGTCYRLPEQFHAWGLARRRSFQNMCIKHLYSRNSPQKCKILKSSEYLWNGYLSSENWTKIMKFPKAIWWPNSTKYHLVLWSGCMGWSSIWWSCVGSVLVFYFEVKGVRQRQQNSFHKKPLVLSSPWLSRPAQGGCNLIDWR